MNNGKICISVCAETADKLIEQIKHAEDLADIVEIRFDCLKKIEIDIFYQKFSRQWQMSEEFPFIVTFRPKEEGGFRKLTEKERNSFWNSGNAIGWADCEEDVIENSWNRVWGKRICSFHDFKSVPDNLLQIYKRLKFTEADVVKIAVQADEITDTIPIWKLLERAKSENKQIIPIAMGEAGKWTRILGLAHGAFLTYSSLNDKQKTAPGQVSAEDLTEVYCAKELDENTNVYGIIAGDTSYSMSPYLHNAAFKFHKLNSVFVPLQVKNLDEFMRRMVLEKTREIQLNFKGFAVTNPHKIEILKYLDFIDEDAKKIGAVNTVKIENGKLYGYNTDADGFIKPLKNSYGNLNGVKVAVIGNGGAARACICALKKENAEVTILARNPEKAKNLAAEFDTELEELPKTKNQKPKTNFNIIVNTTPLGTKGNLENETPLFAEQIKNIHLAYDLVYNPFVTSFLKEAKMVDVPTIGGLAMLVAQAMKQFEIWTNLNAPLKEMSRTALQKLK